MTAMCQASDLCCGILDLVNDVCIIHFQQLFPKATLDAALFWVPGKSSYRNRSCSVLVALEAAEQSSHHLSPSYPLMLEPQLNSCLKHWTHFRCLQTQKSPEHSGSQNCMQHLKMAIIITTGTICNLQREGANLYLRMSGFHTERPKI